MTEVFVRKVEGPRTKYVAEVTGQPATRAESSNQSFAVLQALENAGIVTKERFGTDSGVRYRFSRKKK